MLDETDLLPIPNKCDQRSCLGSKLGATPNWLGRCEIIQANLTFADSFDSRRASAIDIGDTDNSLYVLRQRFLHAREGLKLKLY